MITNKTKRFFNAAKAASELSDFKHFHLGCVAVYDNRFIIASGWCTSKTSPLQAHYNQYRGFNGYVSPAKSHAEIQTIQRLKQLHGVDYSKVTLYIWRTLANGSSGMARMCNSCYRAMMDLGIKDCWYSCDNGFKYEVIK